MFFMLLYTVLLGEYVDIQTIVLLLLFQILISSESPCFAETCINVKEIYAKITIPTRLLHNLKAHWDVVHTMGPTSMCFEVVQ
jgi:hypothetical protein